MNQLSSIILTQFKQDFTDENLLIADAVRRILPPLGDGLIVDVGAGLGDIAQNAFSDRRALLVDTLKFPQSKCRKHTRITADFFDFLPSGSQSIDILLLSHVLQYLDDDLVRLSQKIRQIAPRHIIVVCNRPTRLFAKIERWYGARGIVHNGENMQLPCLMEEYQRCASISLAGAVSCPSFAILAQQLTSVIFDTDLNGSDLMDFEKWLGDQLAEPKVSIPQSVILYEKAQASE